MHCRFDEFMTRHMQSEWKGSIMMPMCRGIDGDLTLVDLCDHVGKKYERNNNGRLYFDLQKFKPTTDCYSSLMKEIQRESSKCGSSVKSNGSQKSKNGPIKRKLVCFCRNRVYDPLKRSELHADVMSNQKNFRKDSLINSDKRGRREQGRTKCRRTSTVLCTPDQSNQCCNFTINVCLDEHGYYLDERTGNPNHRYHCPPLPKNASMPVRLLPDEDQEMLRNMMNSCLNVGCARNYLKSKYGKFFDITSLRNTMNPSIQNKGVEFSDVDELLQFFKDSNDVSYQVLWNVESDFIDEGQTSATSSDSNARKRKHTITEDSDSNSSLSSDCSSKSSDEHAVELGPKILPARKGPLTKKYKKRRVLPPRHCTPFRLVSTMRNAGSSDVSHVDLTDDVSYKELHESTSALRSAAKKEQNIFLGIAWSTVSEINLFKRFPHAVYCDVTGDTNSTRNHLLTFSGRTTAGQQFIFLRVWIHNQSQSSFRWVFGLVLKTFIPVEFHDKVELVLVDGDQQQRAELFSALKSYLKRASVGSCMFHIVQQNWKKNGTSKNCLDTKDFTYYDATVKTLHNWLHSFANYQSVRSPEEYELSKQLLYSYLFSKEVGRVFEHRRNVIKIHRWIVRHVVIWDFLFLGYLKKEKRTYYQKTTSPHEGTNYGMKVHAASCKPSMKLSKSAKALTLQSNLKTMQVGHSASVAASKTKLWTDSSEYQHLIPKCVSLLNDVEERCINYAIDRINDNTWEVIYKPFIGFIPHPNPFASHLVGHDNTTPSSQIYGTSPIPKFWRLHTVTLGKDNFLYCSCKAFESTGIPCAHQACVLKNMIPGWKGFSRYDVSFEWWNLWYEHAYEDSKIGMNLLAMAAFPTRGPHFSLEDMSSHNFTSRDPTVLPPACDRVLNYSKQHIHKVVSKNASSWEGLYVERHDAVNNQDPTQNNDEVIKDSLVEADEDSLLAINSVDMGELRVDQPLNEEKVKPSEKHRPLLYELMHCMDAMDSSEYEDTCIAFIKDKVNHARRTLLEKKNKKGEKGTINVMTEALPRTINRTYHSKN